MIEPATSPVTSRPALPPELMPPHRRRSIKQQSTCRDVLFLYLRHLYSPGQRDKHARASSAPSPHSQLSPNRTLDGVTPAEHNRCPLSDRTELVSSPAIVLCARGRDVISVCSVLPPSLPPYLLLVSSPLSPPRLNPSR